MKYKFTSILLTLCIAASTAMLSTWDNIQAAQIQDSAQEMAEERDTVRRHGDYLYTLNGEYAEILSYQGTDPSPAVPGEIEGRQVITIGSEAFAYSSTLLNVTLPDSIRYIYWSAFCGCENLNDIVFPKNLLSIDDEAFNGCKSFKNITLPESTLKIGKAAFANCSNLKSVTIPASMQTIYASAFSHCGKLKDIFYAGSKEMRKKMKMNSSGNENLMQATIHYNSSDKPEILGSKKGAVLKSGKDTYQVKTDISTVAFVNTASTDAKITVPTYVEIDGIGYTVASIAKNAFKNNKTITKVTIPDGISSIGREAFSGCPKLGTIVIRSWDLSSVGENAFKGIRPTAKIKIPSGFLSYKTLLKGKGQGSKVKIVEL